MGSRVPEEDKASEFLANERTFLAWVRTAIAIMSMGTLLARLSRASLAAGSGLVGLGAVLCLLASWHYHGTSRRIEHGQVRSEHKLVLLVTFLLIILAAVLVGFLLTN